MLKNAIVLGAAILLPEIAAAHPDHASGGDFGWLHFLTDPFHIGGVAVAALILMALRRAMRRQAVERRID